MYETFVFCFTVEFAVHCVTVWATVSWGRVSWFVLEEYLAFQGTRQVLCYTKIYEQIIQILTMPWLVVHILLTVGEVLMMESIKMLNSIHGHTEQKMVTQQCTMEKCLSGKDT